MSFYSGSFQFYVISLTFVVYSRCASEQKGKRIGDSLHLQMPSLLVQVSNLIHSLH